MSKQDEWVRVESQDELRAGMMIRGGGLVGVIFGELTARICTSGSKTKVWDTSRGETCLACPILGGGLLRLAIPPDEAALSDEKEASRRASKVKERTR